MNRGYELLPEIGMILTYVLGESVYHTWSFAEKQYARVPASAYSEQLSLLQSAIAAFPSLRVLTLDYCDPENRGLVREIYHLQRANGFVPYVSTIELNQLHPEPGK
jgi:hypothetical protein